MSTRKIWLDGALVPFEDVQVHLLSQSLQRGTLVFDVMSVHEGLKGTRVFGLTPHLQRFIGSAESMGMQCPYDLETLRSASAASLRANPLSEVLKVCAYYDEVGFGLLPESLLPRVAIAAFGMDDFGGRLGREQPATVLVAARPKLPSEILPFSTKVAAAYTPGVAESIVARRQGADAVLFLDGDGFVREGTSHSFFAVFAGEIHTAPEASVLCGVTRKAVIEIARDQGFRVVERDFSLTDLLAADEAFLTATTVQVWPVGSVNDQVFDPPVGPVTAALRQGLQQLLNGDYPALSDAWLEFPR
ncbi:MAG: aminotransferase class IV [Acidimicrobiales bacterium]